MPEIPRRVKHSGEKYARPPGKPTAEGKRRRLLAFRNSGRAWQRPSMKPSQANFVEVHLALVDQRAETVFW